jgi:hypothetical protein
MDLQPDLHEDRRSRVVAAAEITAFALERDLPHMALGAAREAARSALLALGAAPRGRLSGPDIEVLREVAAAPPQHLAGRPDERQALVRAMLSAVDRLFPRPPATPAGRDQPRHRGAVQPSRRSPDRAHSRRHEA